MTTFVSLHSSIFFFSWLMQLVVISLFASKTSPGPYPLLRGKGMSHQLLANEKISSRPHVTYWAGSTVDGNLGSIFVYIFCFLTIPFTRHHHHLHYTHTLLRTSITGLASTCFWLARRPIFLSGVCKGNGVCLFFWAPNLFTFISVDSFSPFFVLRNSCFSSGSDQIWWCVQYPGTAAIYCFF